MDILPNRIYHIGYTKWDEDGSLHVGDDSGNFARIPQLGMGNIRGFLYHWQGRLYCAYNDSGATCQTIIYDVATCKVVHGNGLLMDFGVFSWIMYPVDGKIWFYARDRTFMRVFSVDLLTFKSNETVVNIGKYGFYNYPAIRHLPYDNVRGLWHAITFANRSGPFINTEYIGNDILRIDIKIDRDDSRKWDVRYRFLYSGAYPQNTIVYDIYSGEKIIDCGLMTSFTPITDNVVAYLIPGRYDHHDIIVYKNLADNTEYEVHSEKYDIAHLFTS